MSHLCQTRPPAATLRKSWHQGNSVERNQQMAQLLLSTALSLYPSLPPSTRLFEWANYCLVIVAFVCAYTEQIKVAQNASHERTTRVKGRSPGRNEYNDVYKYRRVGAATSRTRHGWGRGSGPEWGRGSGPEWGRDLNEKWASLICYSSLLPTWPALPFREKRLYKY